MKYGEERVERSSAHLNFINSENKSSEIGPGFVLLERACQVSEWDGMGLFPNAFFVRCQNHQNGRLSKAVKVLPNERFSLL